MVASGEAAGRAISSCHGDDVGTFHGGLLRLESHSGGYRREAGRRLAVVVAASAAAAAAWRAGAGSRGRDRDDGEQCWGRPRLGTGGHGGGDVGGLLVLQQWSRRCWGVLPGAGVAVVAAVAGGCEDDGWRCGCSCAVRCVLLRIGDGVFRRSVASGGYRREAGRRLAVVVAASAAAAAAWTSAEQRAGAGSRGRDRDDGEQCWGRPRLGTGGHGGGDVGGLLVLQQWSRRCWGVLPGAGVAVVAAVAGGCEDDGWRCGCSCAVRCVLCAASDRRWCLPEICSKVCWCLVMSARARFRWRLVVGRG
ncbi:uncharacterized protein LOC131145669 [Malania oleifera]|uniref:uncharacterized protein LOC131145669 n=1 Tax=Malania oleifera TaxID=397392 RepID=UPI0025AE9727|nr:uncharacterized protein LOC131145669 [Malania oleifera]